MRAVHESLGVIDVSTLGKLLVEGPEAAQLLERLYPNRFGDLRPGRIRYGVLTSDGGRIMDDGTVARLADDLYYVTTTSTGRGRGDRVVRVVERGLGLRRGDRERHRRSRCAEPRRPPGSRGAGPSGRGRRRRLGRGLPLSRLRSSSRSRASPAWRCGSGSSASSGTSSTSRARPRSMSGTACSPRARGRSGSSRSASSGSRRDT